MMITQSMKEQEIVSKYLDYLNNFLTVERFAEYHSLTVEQANYFILEGRKLTDY